MEKGKKQRLAIMGLSWYVIASIFIATYLRLNYLPTEYEGSYWIAVFIHYLSLYVLVAHKIIIK